MTAEQCDWDNDGDAGGGDNASRGAYRALETKQQDVAVAGTTQVQPRLLVSLLKAGVPVAGLQRGDGVVSAWPRRASEEISVTRARRGSPLVPRVAAAEWQGVSRGASWGAKYAKPAGPRGYHGRVSLFSVLITLRENIRQALLHQQPNPFHMDVETDDECDE